MCISLYSYQMSLFKKNVGYRKARAPDASTLPVVNYHSINAVGLRINSRVRSECLDMISLNYLLASSSALSTLLCIVLLRNTNLLSYTIGVILISYTVSL